MSKGTEPEPRVDQPSRRRALGPLLASLAIASTGMSGCAIYIGKHGRWRRRRRRDHYWRHYDYRSENQQGPADAAPTTAPQRQIEPLRADEARRQAQSKPGRARGEGADGPVLKPSRGTPTSVGRDAGRPESAAPERVAWRDLLWGEPARRG